MMRYTLSILAVFIFSVFGCKENEPIETIYESRAEILGLDPRDCCCCGDWRIQIDNEPEEYQFLELPANSGIDLTSGDTFPLLVELEWHFNSSSPCQCQNIIPRIIIERIRLAE